MFSRLRLRLKRSNEESESEEGNSASSGVGQRQEQPNQDNKANSEGREDAILKRTHTHPSRTTSTIQKNEAKKTEINGQHTIYSVTFLTDGKHIVGGGSAGKIRCWQVENGEVVGMPMNAGSIVYDVAVSPDGKWVVSGAGLGHVKLWSVESRRNVIELEGLVLRVNAVDVSPDGTKIATGSNDSTAIIWSLPTGKQLFSFKHAYWVVAAKFSPDGQLFATATLNCASIRVHDVGSGHLLTKFEIKVDIAFNQCLAWGHDNKHCLFVLSNVGYIHHLDTSSGTTLAKWCIGRKNPRCIALASNGTYIAASADSSISFWDTATHEEIGSRMENPDVVRSVAISADHNIVAGAGCTITLRNLRDILPPRYVENDQRLDEKIAALTAELDRLKHSVAAKTAELAVVNREAEPLRHVSRELMSARNELRDSEAQMFGIHRRYNEQLRKFRSTLATNQPSLATMQHFITESDVYVEKEIVSALERLNADVYMISTLMAGRIVNKFQSSRAIPDEQSTAARRTSKAIGQTLVGCLERKTRDAVALYLPIAFRAYLIHYLCHVISSWTVDKGRNELISQMYKRLQESESQTFCGRWRSLIHTYISSSFISDADALISTAIQGLSDIVVIAGCAASAAVAQAKFSSSFRHRISFIIATARQLRKSIGVALAADFRLVTVHPTNSFDENTMEVDLGERYGQGRERPRGAVRGRKVLCATHLGLRKEVVVETPDPQKENTLVTTTMIKGKVLLESSLDRLR